jgi:sulfur-oxidizing protein SoxX
MKSTTFRKSLIVVAASALVAGCASLPSSAELDAMTDRIVKASFRDQGVAKVDRVLATDETNRLCSQADVAGKPLDDATAKRIEETNLKAIKWPSDGKFLGNWKQGETIAQSGRGLTWTDDAKAAAGGNCYNCHQISKEEISHGTLGPSLYNFGKLRGNSEAVVKYTWGKIYNAKAFNACTNMPRFGHQGILTEGQMKDLMALLLDPASPVNK